MAAETECLEKVSGVGEFSGDVASLASKEFLGIAHFFSNAIQHRVNSRPVVRRQNCAQPLKLPFLFLKSQ